MKKKKFKLFDAILATVCITLVAESVAPTASIGNAQYFWWIFIIIAFVLPYGMISAELGTAYPSEGGMYDWVKRAFGPKWAGRVAWNYWVNFPLWIASLATMITVVLGQIFGIDLNIFWLLVIQLGYTWLVTFLSTHRIGESKTLVNIGAVFKILFMVGLGALGIYVFCKTGHSANPIHNVKDLLPTLDVDSISFVSIIIFNVLGFEVVATFVNDMEKPKKEIPKALLIGGAIMALFYLLPATGMNIAIPADQLSLDSGLIESFDALLPAAGIAGGLAKGLIIAVGLMFIYTFIANIASWSFGVNSVAKYAADDGTMPRIFKKTNSEGVPYMAAIINGIVASVIIIGGIIAGAISESVGSNFELFFKLSWITLLIGYIPMFLAFIKLRRTDGTKRVYKVPGGPVLLNIMAFVPFVILVLGIVFTIFGDFSLDYVQEYLPLIVGVIISFVIEELLVARLSKSTAGWVISFIIAAALIIVYFTKVLPALNVIWITGIVGTIILGLFHLFGTERPKKEVKE
ncbi:MAG: amino acid permease [Bacilli bacterium]|nr:amino acid permease [Bacilli bacterium]